MRTFYRRDERAVRAVNKIDQTRYMINFQYACFVRQVIEDNGYSSIGK